MRSLKVYLAILIAGVVLPGLLFGIGVSRWLAAEMRQTVENEARATVGRIATDVSEHVHLVMAAMKTLARSQSLARQDLGEAYRYAVLLSADIGQHIGLATVDGQQLFNTRRPLGSVLPRRADPVSYTRALETDRPSVSNVIVGAISGRPLVTIDVPVATRFGPRVLGTSTDVATIGTVLARTPLKPDWKAAIIDGDGRFIARTLNPERFIGQLAVPELIAVAKGAEQEGTLRHRSHEGEDLYTFFAKVPGTPWTVVIGTPEPVLFAPLNGTLALLAAAGAATILVTLSFAVGLGVRLDAAARRLTAGAAAMGRGEELPPLSQTIAEFEQVEEVLHDAARLSRQRQAELARAREAAERSAAAKTRLLAAANHDLRQPLHASGLGIEMLQHLTMDSTQRQVVDRLARAHASMTRMIASLLDIARADSDVLATRIEAVSLASLLAEVVEEIGPAAAEKGLALRQRRRFEVVVATDRELLRRILRNLVCNAIRYTPAGGVLVALRHRGGVPAIEVWDTGIGIAPDQLGMIWEEFYRSDEARRDSSDGLGLGLAIVQRLSAALGCRVEVRSRPGRGSLFRISLPAA